jgi:hypothetical protein
MLSNDPKLVEDSAAMLTDVLEFNTQVRESRRGFTYPVTLLFLLPS